MSSRFHALALYFVAALGISAQQVSSNDPPVTDRERMLLDRIEQLERRVSALEAKQANAASPATSVAQSSAVDPQAAPQSQPPAAQPAASSTPAGASLLGGTTVNILLDGYYQYNFNNPIGRVNLLRAYDVTSNAFSLNQADLVLENAPDAAKGKPFGLRLDFQYGQATQTLQGNPLNEPRPDIYRNIFQAYGTYIIPLGSGLTIDFGKFASSLGTEGNYTKDQMNYSRAFWFDFLPFYHMGLRAKYTLNSKVTFNYWIVNGTNQTEPFNGYKNEFFGFTIQPAKTLTWNVNYYLGQEHPDVVYYPNGAPANLPNLPTEQGLPFAPIVDAPNGKLHIFDSYFTWQPSPKVAFGLEGDYVIERLLSTSYPAHTDGGAIYLQYQFTPKLSIAGRAEYLSDRGGLFTGVTQAVKETTFTTKYQLADGFLAMLEWRRDFSNRPYFLSDTLGILKREQNTATLGLVWWFGGKQGAW